MSIGDRIWATGKQATQEEVIELTNQFYVTLRAYFAQIKKTGAAANSRNKDAFERIQALLEPQDGQQAVQNWTNAYEIEQLLVHLFDDDTVATELAIRLLEARSILRPELAAMYDSTFHDIENPAAAATNAPATPIRRRTLLARLVNDLQWRYIVNEAKRRYSKLITRRTATLSVIALIIFVAAIVVIAMQAMTFNYGDLHLLWVAGLAGTWGATFSMLATLKSRLDQSKFDDLKLMKAGSVLLSRVAIGAGAASILFFFLLSGLLGGTAFPVLTKPAAAGRAAAGAAATISQGFSSAASSPGAPSASSTLTPSTSTPSTSTPSTSTPSTSSSTPAESKTPAQTPAPASQPAPSPAQPQTPKETGKKPEPTTPDRTGTTGAPTQPERIAEDNRLPMTDLALLIVWCFIAGFSEQLIPGLLASTEARAGTVVSTTDRFRPTTGTTQIPPPGPSGQQTANTVQPAAQQSQTPPGKTQSELPKTG